MRWQGIVVLRLSWMVDWCLGLLDGRVQAQSPSKPWRNFNFIEISPFFDLELLVGESFGVVYVLVSN